MKLSVQYTVLFAGLVLVSTAGPFIVCAHMDAFAVAFWRLCAASALFAIMGAVSGNLRISRADLKRTAIGGSFFAIHLALWLWAFDLTDFASNLLLLVVQPIAAALLGAQLGEKTTRATWYAVGVAVVGLAIIAKGDFALGPRALAGDAISVLSGVAIASFYAVTRSARRATPLPAFMAVSMGAGAVVLLPLVLLTNTRLVGYPARSWEWLAALVLVTTVGGHGLMNIVARRVTLFTLHIGIVLEPPIGMAMGIPLLGATITPIQIAGGIILSIAVVIGLLPELKHRGGDSVAELEGAQ